MICIYKTKNEWKNWKWIEERYLNTYKFVTIIVRTMDGIYLFVYKPSSRYLNMERGKNFYGMIVAKLIIGKW